MAGKIGDLGSQGTCGSANVAAPLRSGTSQDTPAPLSGVNTSQASAKGGSGANDSKKAR